MSLNDARITLQSAKFMNYDADLRITITRSTTQITSILNYIPYNLYGMVWISVTDPDDWPRNTDYNCQYVKSMLKVVKAQGKRTGIYSDRASWTSIIGDKCTDLAEPLHYINYDGFWTFGDFIPFGGWYTPSLKTYKQANDCNVSAQFIYHP